MDTNGNYQSPADVLFTSCSAFTPTCDQGHCQIKLNILSKICQTILFGKHLPLQQLCGMAYEHVIQHLVLDILFNQMLSLQCQTLSSSATVFFTTVSNSA